MELLKDLDTALFLFLNGLNHPAADPVMKAISGKWTWIPLYVLVLVMLVYHFRKQSWIMVIAAIIVLVFTDLASVHLFKNVFLRLRPCHEPALQGMVHIIDGRCGGLYGFVSSHAANTFGFATLITALFRKKIRWSGWVLFPWAVLVGYSRIYLGVHYPGDIIGGALLGMLTGWLVWRLLRLVT